MSDIKNLDKLVVKLENIANVDLTQVLDRVGYLVEDAAKGKCPVDTGQLRSSITHEVNDNSVLIGTNVEYAPYVEFGTGIHAVNGDGRQTAWRYKTADGSWHTTTGQEAQPFLQPALNENKEQITQIIKDGIKEALKK